MLKRRSRIFRTICCLLTFALVQTSFQQVQAQPTPFLPPGQNYFVDLSAPYSLPVLRGMRVYPAKPFEFDFVVDAADHHKLDEKETSLLIKYFLTCLTIPQQDLWVNLSPYESGRIIPDELAVTNAGNMLLQQDKLLKQMAASLTYPETDLGRKFWQEVYRRAYARFGTTDLPVNTYNKVWIVPDKAIVYDMGDTALIGDTHLKVLLEEDYLALKKHELSPAAGRKDLHQLSAAITRDIILPQLEKEVNEGRNFAPVRQIFHSMVLAAWFKRALKRNILSDVYVNQKKVSGIDGVDKRSKEEIYRQYLRIYKVGAYNYIREDVDPVSQQVVPRKYFSGGVNFGAVDAAMRTLQVPNFQALRPYLDAAQASGLDHAYGVAKVDLVPIGGQDLWARMFIAKISSGTIKRLAAAVAVAVTLSAGGMAQAAVITQNPDGSKHVQVEQGDTFGQILLSLGFHYGGDFWGPNGTVAKAAHSARPAIADINHIPVGSPFDISVPDVQVAAKTLTPGPELTLRKVEAAPRDGGKTRLPLPVRPLTEAAPRLEGVPAPALAVSSAPGKAIEQTRDFYPISTDLVATPVVENVVARYSGIVQGLDPDKREYQEGETIFTIQNLDLDSRIKGLSGELAIREKSLASLGALFNAHAATTDELNQARQQVQSLQQQLAQAQNEKMISIVKAPYHLRVNDIKVANGVAVSTGMPLLSYVDLQRIRLELNVPIKVNYFNDIALSLNGEQNRAKSVFAEKWLATPSPFERHLNLIVTPSTTILPGQNVRVVGKIFLPDKGPAQLRSVVGKQHTITAVNQVEDYPLTTPVTGRVDFIVKEGDNVKAGQVLARVDSRLYREGLERVDQQIRDIDVQLQMAAPGPDGTQYVPRSQLDGLRATKAMLLAQRSSLREQVSGAEIRAPYDGVIVWSAGNGSTVFAAQDMLFRISTGTVFIGDINDNARNPVLFSDQWSIKSGDPVMVETPQGTRLLAQVAGVNHDPVNSSIQLGHVQSVKVKVFDPQHALRPNLPVRVTLLTDTEGQAVAALLSASNRTQALSSPAPPPPEPPATSLERHFSKRRALPIVAANYASAPAPVLPVRSPQTVYVSQEPSLNLDQLAALVIANRLNASHEEIGMLISKAREDLPGALQLSLIGGVWDSNGRLSFAGGAQGAFNGISGALMTGNAYAAGLPIVAQLAGNIIDHLDGRVAKERAASVTQTRIDYYHWVAAQYQQVSRAQKLLIELGADQQQIAQLQALLKALEPALGEIKAREASGFSVTADRLALEQKIENINLQLSDLQMNMQDRVVELNTLTGQPFTGLNGSIFAGLPWTDSFPMISRAQEERLLAELTRDTSLNPQMQEMIATLKKMKQDAGLQGLDELPQINLNEVQSNKDINGAIYAVVPGAIENASKLQSSNTILGIRIPLIDQALGTKEKIASLSITDAQNGIMRMKLELAKGLDQSIIQINSLSLQIRQAHQAYGIAYTAWAVQAARPGLYLPHQLADARLQMQMWQQKEIELKAKYMQAKSNFWQLGLRFPDNGGAAADQAQLASLFSRAAFAGVLALMPLAAGAQEGTGPQAGVESPDTNPAREWILMQGSASGQAGNSLEAAQEILVDDPDILTRRDTLQYLFSEYQNSGDFMATLGKIMAASPYPDVTEQIFKYMADLKDHDLSFFVQAIAQAVAQHNTTLEAQAYRSLEDILTNDPNVFSNLSGTDFTASASAAYTAVSAQTAQRVFLTFLAASPDSVAAARLLQSDYWSPQDLAKNYNTLTAYLKAHPDDPQAGKIKELTALLHDAILRKEALANIDIVFSKALYASLPAWAPYEDFINRVRIEKLAEQNKTFLLTSPQWRQMKEYIKPDLYRSASQATEDIIASNPATAEGAPLYPYIPAPQNDFLGYFNSLDTGGQHDYIANTQNLAELGRILASGTILREEALNRLMGSFAGRVLVLKAYAESQDTGLLDLVDSRPWTRTIRADVQAVGNPAETRIIRAALEKMYGRIHSGWPLDARLGTFTLDLYSARDPRGTGPVQAQIRFVAAQWAEQVFATVNASYIVPYVGFQIQKPEVTSFLENVNKLATTEFDPQEFNKDLDSLVTSGSSRTDDIRWRFPSIRDKMAVYLSSNDQNIPRVTALVRYSVGVLTLITAFFAGRRIWRRVKKGRADIPGLLKILRNETVKPRKARNNGTGNGSSDKAMVIVSEDMYAPAYKPLHTWQQVLDRWSPDTPLDEMLNDFNLMLNNAAKALRLMPYSPNLIWSNARALNAEYNRSYLTFFQLAAATLYLMSERLRHSTITDEVQRQRIMMDIQIMQENMRYVVRYLRILQYRGNVNTVMKYKFDDDHWAELHGWGPYVWARGLLLYNYLRKTSQRKLEDELPRLLDEGNWLMPGLYENPEAIIAASKERLQEVVEEGRTFSDAESPGGNMHEMRSFRSRVLVLGGMAALVVTGLALYFDIPWLILSLSAVSSLTVFGIVNFWITNVGSLGMPWNRTVNTILGKLEEDFKGLWRPSDDQGDGFFDDTRIVSLARQEGAKEIDIEMDPRKAPRVDAIVIVSEDEGEVTGLQEHVRDIRGHLIRNDVPVEVVHPRFRGSGNAYFDALQMIKNKFESGAYHDSYPHLRPWEEARVLFIFHGKEAVQNNNLIDWGITNGYRAAASMSRVDDRPGNIIIYTRDVYYGPIQQVPGADITLLTSRVSRDELKSLGWVSTSFSEDGESEVHEILEKLNFEELMEQDRRERRGSKTVQFFRSRLYDVNNASLKQYSAFNGIILMGPRAVAMNVRIARHLQDQNNRLMATLPIHLTSDVLIPQLKGRNPSDIDWGHDINDYVERRVTWSDMEGTEIRKPKKGLKALYTIIREAERRDIQIHAFLPHPKADLYVPNMVKNGSTHQEVLDTLQVADGAMVGAAHPAKNTGGIDLNFQPQFIQRPPGPGEPSSAAIPFARPNESFKGFKFNIVRFTPALTVNGAFQLMLNSN